MQEMKKKENPPYSPFKKGGHRGFGIRNNA